MSRQIAQSILSHSLKLAGFGLLTALLLGLVHSVTEDRIANQARQAERQALLQILPAAVHDNDLLDAAVVLDPAENTENTENTESTESTESAESTESTFSNMELLGLEARENAYIARFQGNVSGVILPVLSHDGYNGEIRLMVGILAPGIISGVRVVRHSETPGLGDKIDIRLSDWITAFNGRSLDNPAPPQWTVVKNGGAFDQFAGATITPRAVTVAVRKALEFYHANREVFSQGQQAP